MQCFSVHAEVLRERSMKIDKETIHWVAELARISLSPDEEREMQTQLARILDYMDVLNELDLSTVEPTAHALGYTNVMRGDDPGQSFDIEVVEELAPQWERGYVIVPRIV
jgi:aspartyl-tRNA(Asn)/glutamyl-tRNA(Gln) amidotransferase subunit C